MTTYNTKDPIGSASVKNLYDNSENLDKAVNDRDNETWTDRLGAERISWHGMEMENARLIEKLHQDMLQAILSAGYAPVGSFQEGAEVKNYNETVLWKTPEGDGDYYRWGGDLPKSVPENSTPETTGGIKTEDNPSGLWVSVGDASLRSDLNKIGGAALIKTRTGATVDDAIAEMASDLTKLPILDDTVTSTLGGLLQFSQQVQNQVTSNEWGAAHAVVLGDSISHGANALDIYASAYVSHLKRMINATNNSNEWGFISIKDQIGSTVGINQERHKVTLNDWSVMVNADASHTVNGAYATTSSTSSELLIKIPPTCKFFRVWYTKQMGGGEFTVTRDGVILNTVDTAISSGNKQGWFWVVNGNATCNPDETGTCTLSIKNITDGKPVEILGVSYANNWSLLQLSNFSQAGRRLIHVDDSVLDKVIKGANPFILALGHNDRNSTASENALFTAKIDKIIQVAVAQKVRVIVCDFCWDKNITNHVRAELKRCAASIPNAIWLPFPQFLMPSSDGAPVSWYKDALSFTSDSSHPTPFGHKLIAESIAKAMGLTIFSTSAALDKNYIPFNLTSSGLSNSVLSRYEYYSGYRIELDGVSIRGSLRKSGASNVPAGTYNVGNLKGVFLPSITEIKQGDFTLSIASGSDPAVKIIVPSGYAGSTVSFNVYLLRNT
ncbi:hypothetical protein [Providencia sp. PROV273]|uniref:tail fiber/spike domain-containing protein n=1 Tax=Providencia sp. PROV273 TaxID=2949960 RepID=UPI00234A9975|nr:hypothetical protein [Providencia sp. PROV273]